MRQEDIDIERTGDTLTLRGERKFENEERRNDFVRVERSYGRFQRSFTLGVPVQHDQVRATYRDGVLEVHLPKSEETRPRKVQVSVEGGSAPAAMASANPAPSEEAGGDANADTSSVNTAASADAGSGANS